MPKIECCDFLKVPSWLRRAKEEYGEPSGMSIDLLSQHSDGLPRVAKHPQNNHGRQKMTIGDSATNIINRFLAYCSAYKAY